MENRRMIHRCACCTIQCKHGLIERLCRACYKMIMRMKKYDLSFLDEVVNISAFFVLAFVSLAIIMLLMM